MPLAALLTDKQTFNEITHSYLLFSVLKAITNFKNIPNVDPIKHSELDKAANLVLAFEIIGENFINIAILTTLTTYISDIRENYEFPVTGVTSLPTPSLETSTLI